MQAASLEPTEARAAAAFAAARGASDIAARRGALPRAVELLEHAAELAPDLHERVETLSNAADLAMRMLRGHNAYRLLSEAGRLAEEAGETRVAAEKYALAVEIPTRSGGISGYEEEGEVAALLRRARELEPNPDLRLAGQLKVDEAWFAWRYRSEEMDEPAREALELARASGDARLLSSALDAVGATAQDNGRFNESLELMRERMELLESVGQAGIFRYEGYDASLMLTEVLIRVGDLRGAIGEERRIAAELEKDIPHRAYAKGLVAFLFVGEWDEALERAGAIRASWIEQGRPTLSALAGDVGTIGFILGVRDDDPGARDWFSLAEEMSLGARSISGVRYFQGDLAYYRGDPERALQTLDSVEPDFWWAGQVRMKRAEVLGAMRDPAAQTALEAAERAGTEDPLMRAVLLRGRGLLHGDAGLMREACAILDRHEYAFEAARTRWLLGGEERQAAEPVLARLGAVVPAEVA
jgi:tetratricopeptide (TPR) repeat protein